MLTKKPKPSSFNPIKWLKRGVLVACVVEGLSFAFAYGVWYKVNTDRDLRYYLKDNYPYFLELYYKAGETLDSNCRVRQLDNTYWDANKEQL